MTPDRYTLANPQPRRAPQRLDPDDRRQRGLFAGLDCLAGQGDLFGTDGDDDDAAAVDPGSRAGRGGDRLTIDPPVSKR